MMAGNKCWWSLGTGIQPTQPKRATLLYSLTPFYLPSRPVKGYILIGARAKFAVPCNLNGGLQP